jgi:hypothetical protein
MKKSRSNAAKLSFGVLSAVLISACASSRVVSIKTLLDDPRRFNGKAVEVHGETTQTTGALGYAEYQIDDGTGKLTVVTQHNGAPRKGAQVRVRGKFRSVGTIGSKSASVLEETKRVD